MCSLICNLIFVLPSLWLLLFVYRFSESRSICLCGRGSLGFSCDCYGTDLRNATTEWAQSWLARRF